MVSLVITIPNAHPILLQPTNVSASHAMETSQTQYAALTKSHIQVSVNMNWPSARKRAVFLYYTRADANVSLAIAFIRMAIDLSPLVCAKLWNDLPLEIKPITFRNALMRTIHLSNFLSFLPFLYIPGYNLRLSSAMNN